MSIAFQSGYNKAQCTVITPSTLLADTYTLSSDTRNPLCALENRAENTGMNSVIDLDSHGGPSMAPLHSPPLILVQEVLVGLATLDLHLAQGNPKE